MDEEDQLRFGFDLLDPTKIVPEEYVPLTKIGKMTLNRNPRNYFAETEQVMVCATVSSVIPLSNVCSSNPATSFAASTSARILSSKGVCSRTSTRSSTATAAPTLSSFRSTSLAFLSTTTTVMAPARCLSLSIPMPTARTL